MYSIPNTTSWINNNNNNYSNKINITTNNNISSIIITQKFKLLLSKIYDLVLCFLVEFSLSNGSNHKSLEFYLIKAEETKVEVVASNSE